MATRKKQTVDAKFKRGRAKVARKGVRNPDAVMASALRKKHGQKALTRAARAGRRRKRR